MVSYKQGDSAIDVEMQSVLAAYLFIQDYRYRGYLSGIKQQIVEMTLNGSGIRDTVRVLKISPTTVIETLKKSPQLKTVNEARLLKLEPTQTVACFYQLKQHFRLSSLLKTGS